MSNITPIGYAELLSDIKQRIRSAQYEALKAVNKELIALYWDIGKSIVEKQKKTGWGKSVVIQLAKDLQEEFPGIGGFSSSNLWRARLFYETYADKPKLAPLVREIAWSHNVLIFEKCKDAHERQFYIMATKKFGWSKNVLIHQIENKSYEKYLLNQTNFDKTVPENIRHQAKLAVKDHYTFDFLELADEHSEHQLEQALIKNIRNFLCEMGYSFAFLGNQFRLTVDEEDFFIDLLLYHRELQCLVAIELKIGDFKPEYKGKMEFYLNLLNDKIKLPRENDSIGIIICKNKKRTIVEYALKKSVHPIGVSTYSISPALPASYKNILPDAKTIARKLQAFNLNSVDEEADGNG
ncbi:MAG: PDDEXK nuclease domain-containing protein [Deltaproteobacteria bacterium]|nr:PDDEXK nuclease domain-containing protein [Deltaproteobacteria bacterium]